ncbi:hypothetical protein K457DRAFT_25955 [Linnemannia elongata AG-77]|uniref:Uncharacterized protein n=1 Tax=Linnemannia elongata AG-77 TaxID=1314771 RepID=A0A197JC25_9FUNG|nr:hypothetical protein K457DRAFT_25955 [Linnemannia elongata AG-77]
MTNIFSVFLSLSSRTQRNWQYIPHHYYLYPPRSPLHHRLRRHHSFPHIPLSATASKTACQVCVDKTVLNTMPLCKDIDYLGTTDTLVFYKLSNKDKTRPIAASNDWYHTCERSDACSASMMEEYDGLMAALKSKVFCPNGGVFTDTAAMGLGVAAFIGALV